MPRFHALDVDVQRNVTRFAIELYLQELAEQRHAPDEWQRRPPMTLSRPSIVANLKTP